MADKSSEQQPAPKETKTIDIPKVVTVRKLAEILNAPVTKIIAKLLEYGVAANINESVDFDTAAIIADEFGWQAIEVVGENIIALKEKTDKKNLQIRPPVVTVMGHVDHGKTKLLDAIRQTDVVAGESGGITQHIGAYQLTFKNLKNKKERLITFLDTPGHEAFSAMRSHGARITDIVVLVVAADEGVKPQTLEALSHAKAANVPIVVAINKIDKPEADIERVKRQLADIGLLAEEWGGQTLIVPVSAKTGENVAKLLEIILLAADVQKLQANPDGPASGVVIEAHLHHGIGPLATVLVQNGTLRLKDVIIAGKTYGKVKNMENYLRQKVKEAFPSTPVRIGGLKAVPKAGDILFAVLSEKQAREKISAVLQEEGAKRIVKAISARQLSEDEKNKIKKLKIVLKADVQGSLEAIKQSLKDLSAEDVIVEFVAEAVGPVSESDVKMAQAAGAIIVAFRVKIPTEILKLAKLEKIQISQYDIIYNLIDDIFKALSSLLEPEIIKTYQGRLKILKIFKKSKTGGIIGGLVTKGQVISSTVAEVLRDETVLGEIKILSVQQNKQVVDKVAENTQCGISFEGSIKIKPDDILEVYSLEKKIKQLGKPVA
ncbi:MAG: translation initiation factor IF-2 [Candidatus Nealsonbacteria bacterium CG23_combo_of_CG06-09_8_20_14_all_40_13]|uniref:Translation initiation factor IF-2 n=1 Tax=Candidatus Nealsonbacteria bacterium CG23_combo_of_CG06-09_8_20_14_all_40_13 TaxID=1974724 RepID=A0A2G9YT71_9BACT|nr:MAG: translation initiation factor IF-2 [Candidatus Nealsonbacteria bacterium CG23_combo_of_CG06-09_8_20_14_all_40_13]PIR71003.1 MAG: translation initiation factor IF-2 [Candidatus Nealsonbacteria bacterium CG10_big_fil_rev_8_21_14_0_10_40_24]